MSGPMMMMVIVLRLSYSRCLQTAPPRGAMEWSARGKRAQLELAVIADPQMGPCWSPHFQVHKDQSVGAGGAWPGWRGLGTASSAQGM